MRAKLSTIGLSVLCVLGAFSNPLTANATDAAPNQTKLETEQSQPKSDQKQVNGEPVPLSDVEQASLALEYVSIHGKEEPLTLRTLAALQRQSQETALKDRLAKIVLQANGTINTASSNKANPAHVQMSVPTEKSEVNTAPVEPVGHNMKGDPSDKKSDESEEKPAKTIPSNTLVSVFGRQGQLQAEIYAGKNTIKRLSSGDQYSGWHVVSVKSDGVLVSKAGMAGAKHIAVGEQLQ